MKRKEAAFWTAQALVFIAVVGLAALPGVSVQQTTTSSVTAASNEPYQILKQNLTIGGEGVTAEIACGIPALTCPQAPSPYPQCCTLYEVDLISYQGDYYYYLYSHTLVGGTLTITTVHTNSDGSESTTTSVNQNPTLAYTTWFTNTTVYCISPEGNWGVRAPICPV